MRRFAVPPACLALLLAFFMAPYQHVHLAMGHEAEEHHPGDHDHDGAGGHDDDAAIVHVHFYSEPAEAGAGGAPLLDHPDRDHLSRPLDTFATLPATDLQAPYLSASRISLIPPAQFVVALIDSVEHCGHDPPLLSSSTPRAPPV